MKTEIEIRFIFTFSGNLVHVVQQDCLLSRQKRVPFHTWLFEIDQRGTTKRAKQTAASTSLQLHKIGLVSEEKSHTHYVFFCTHLFDSSVYTCNLPSYRSKGILFFHTQSVNLLLFIFNKYFITLILFPPTTLVYYYYYHGRRRERNATHTYD